MDVRDTLLLACGSVSSRGALRSIFEDNFNLLEADNTYQALLFLKQNHLCIAAVLLDTTVPEKISTSILEEMEKSSLLGEIPVVVLAEENNPNIVAASYEQGATDVVLSNYDPFILQHRVQNIVGLHRHKWYLEELVEEQEVILRHFTDAMVDALSSIIEYRSVESGQHIFRIRHFTKILLDEIARHCPEYNLTDATINIISSASALHDIGKIAIPDSILNKNGKLTAEEWAVMKSHSLSGCHILESLHDVGNQEYLRYAHNICHYHHERWNGGGYPEGIAGDDIPICAQVVGLADAYDALTTKRQYKEALPYGQAVNMILNGECGIFSPKLLECFKGVTDKFEALARAYADGLSPKSEDFNVTLPGPESVDASATLQTIQAKYQTLVHHINGATFEVDLDQKIYHAVYNPYLELAPLSSSNSFEEVITALYNLVIPEEHDQILALLYDDIPHFLSSGSRRQIYHFHIKDNSSSQSLSYQLTLLRQDPNSAGRKMMLIWQRCSDLEDSQQIAESVDTLLPEDVLHSLVSNFFLCCNDRWFTLMNADTELASLLGYSSQELQTNFHNHLIELAAAEDRMSIRQKISEQLNKGTAVECSYPLRHKDGRTIWVLNKSYLITGEDGKEYLYGTLTDITQSHEIQTGLRLSLEQYQTILAQTGSIIFEWDVINDTISFSKQWKDIFGYEPIRENLLSKITTASHFHPEDIPAFFHMFHSLQNGAAYHAIEVRIANSDGRYLWCRFQATAVRDEEGIFTKVMGIVLNIDEEKRAAKALQDRAERDALTKLLNKQTARSQAEDYLASFPQGAQCAMLIIDLDNFKQVNDQYGHMFGDAVLAQTAKEIKKQFRSQDIIARIGGDEFMVLMRGISDRQLITQRCRRLLSVLHNIFHSQMDSCPLSCSIGVALAPEHGTTYFDLFQHADQALYQTKDSGKNGFSFYSSKDSSFLNRKKELTAVSERIDSNEQPGLADRSIVQYTFQKLYQSDDIESTVNDILELVGQQMNVSRVYIFENSLDNKACKNTFEWCNTGIEPQMHNLQSISYEDDIPGYADNFDEQGIFYCPDVRTLPKAAYDIVNEQGIKSMLQCAIRDNGQFRGYIGFDECTTNRYWTKEQISTLSFFSEMLATVLLKKRFQDEKLMQAENMRSILNNQNAWIYAIDPDTCQLKFLNAKAKALAPDVEEGMLCHQGLMGLEERCPGCPARDIRRLKTGQQILVNKQFGAQVLAESTLIHWGDEEACLITCRELTNTLFPR